jgi:hypothetical protein
VADHNAPTAVGVGPTPTRRPRSWWASTP